MSELWFYPPPTHTQTETLLATIFGNSPQIAPIISSDLQNAPFRGLLFWSRSIQTSVIRKSSQYSFSFWLKTVKKAKVENIATDHQAYWEWRKTKPEEDLVTPFGKKILAWGEIPFVYNCFKQATRFYAGYLIRENRKAISAIKSGRVFLENDWGRLIEARSYLASLESAMYSLDMTNAGFWDYDCAFAENSHWIEALWVILRHQKLNPTDFHKDWQHLRSQQDHMGWWLHPIDPNCVPHALCAEDTDFIIKEVSV
mgnify:CR=1 FL=1